MMARPVKSKRPQKGPIYDSVSRPAPTLGWNARDALANMKPGYAIYMDNWVPETSSVVGRKGAVDWLTAVPAAVQAVFAWNGAAGTSQLYAFTNSGVFDATTAGVCGATVYAGITSGQVRAVNYNTTGGSFLYCVNGVDDAVYYNGTVWTAIPSFPINGGGTLLTPNIVNINVFKRSLYFLEAGSMSFFYLPIDSITGTVSRFPLGALFSKGGRLIAMGTWSIDGGNGVEDYAAFVTSEGQVAVYQGTDPAAAATWALVGVFELAPPIGYRCFCKFGGDLLLVTQQGIFPLSKALLSASIRRDVAITDIISAAFASAAETYGSNFGWQPFVHTSANLFYVNIPVTASTTSYQFVMNTINGAWCRFKGWNAQCFEVMGEDLYMGMATKVARAWFGANDFDQTIVAVTKTAFDYYGQRAEQKHTRLIRAAIQSSGTVAVDLALDVNFNDGQGFGPTTFAPAPGALWDVGIWDQDVWTGESQTNLDWRTVAAAPGFCSALRLRCAYKDATVRWSAVDYAFERGGLL